MKIVNDPAHYREISTPFTDVEKANEALAAFFADVKTARDKYQIPDVVVLCEVAHMLEGEEVRGSASCNYGDSSKTLPMLAKAYGAEQARHEDMLALLVAGGRRKGPR